MTTFLESINFLVRLQESLSLHGIVISDIALAIIVLFACLLVSLSMLISLLTVRK